MFERWMNKKNMKVSTVERTATKFREMMSLNKHASSRSKGMGMKTMNFHQTMHATEQMLDFGVPENVNTKSNEMHHKPDKGTAQQTNNQLCMFDSSVAKKSVERSSISLGKLEIKGRKRSNYSSGNPELVEETTASGPFEPYLTGVKTTFSMNEQGELVFKVYS